MTRQRYAIGDRVRIRHIEGSTRLQRVFANAVGQTGTIVRASGTGYDVRYDEPVTLGAFPPDGVGTFWDSACTRFEADELEREGAP